MCFSATASFSASAMLGITGAFALKKAEKPNEKPFAAIPLLFSAQQLCEGYLWLSLNDPLHYPLSEQASYLFLFFAQVLWPVWVPFSVMRISAGTKGRLLRIFLLAMGVVVAAYLAFCLVRYPVSAEIGENHIHYLQDYPAWLKNYAGGLYLLVTILPLMITMRAKMRWLGISIFISYLITWVFYNDYIVSVWCFFAAVISVQVLFIVLEAPAKQQVASG